MKNTKTETPRRPYLRNIFKKYPHLFKNVHGIFYLSEKCVSLLPMTAELIPIAIDVTQGQFYTIWAPLWREDEEVWEAFLGNSDRILAFSTPGELYAYCQQKQEHVLCEHPVWHQFIQSPANNFLPSKAAFYDLISVMDLAAQPPSYDTLHNLSDIFSFIERIAEICNLLEVQEFLQENPLLLELGHYASNLQSNKGKSTWLNIQRTILHGYDAILDRIESNLEIITIENSLAQETNLLLQDAHNSAGNDIASTDNLLAENSTLPADSAVDPISQDITDSQADPIADIVKKFTDSLWYSAGIDPIKIIGRHGIYWSLRCYFGEDVIFFGKKKKIYTFTSEDELLSFLSAISDENSDHSFAKISTFPDVTKAAKNNDLEIIITPENTYDLTNLHYEITRGPKKINAPKLEMACELIEDFANYSQQTELLEALEPAAPLGWFKESANNFYHDQKQKAYPPEPYDHESEQWQILEDSLYTAFTSV